MSAALVFFCFSTRQTGVPLWVRTLTGSTLTHVAIGHGGVVLNPEVRGDRLWPLGAYAERYPGIAWCVTVPLVRPLGLAHGLDAKPRPVWPSVARWATRGLVPARDCVAVVAGHLRAGGVPVPRNVVSPVSLFRYLSERYAATPFDRLPARGD